MGDVQRDRHDKLLVAVGLNLHPRLECLAGTVRHARHGQRQLGAAAPQLDSADFEPRLVADGVGKDRLPLLGEHFDFIRVQHRVPELQLDVLDELAVIRADLALTQGDDVVDADDLVELFLRERGGSSEGDRQQQDCRFDSQHRWNGDAVKPITRQTPA